MHWPRPPSRVADSVFRWAIAAGQATLLSHTVSTATACRPSTLAESVYGLWELNTIDFAATGVYLVHTVSLGNLCVKVTELRRVDINGWSGMYR